MIFADGWAIVVPVLQDRYVPTYLVIDAGHFAMKLLSSRAFNQDVSHAKRLAQDGPVVVTDRGRPTHVLVGIDLFRHLSGQGDGIVEVLAIDEPVTTDPDWRAIRGRVP